MLLLTKFGDGAWVCICPGLEGLCFGLEGSNCLLEFGGEGVDEKSKTYDEPPRNEGEYTVLFERSFGHVVIVADIDNNARP